MIGTDENVVAPLDFEHLLEFIASQFDLDVGPDTPVIIVTGISDDFRKFISTRRQVPPPEGYISKPVDFEQFLGMVRELLA